MASRWIPLESNPDANHSLWVVLNSWSTKAGLVPSCPQPVKAVVLLFPISPESEARRKTEDEAIASKGQPELDPTIIWIKQTISNACGTMGLIHAIANSDATLEPLSPLAQRAGQAFVPVSVNSAGSELHLVLETTPLFADIHAQAASSGQSAVPTDLDTNLHFTCFARGVVELDGRRNGPIDRGACTDLLAVRPHLYPEQLLITTGRGLKSSANSTSATLLRVCTSM
ncbi:peptidase C12 ubiquitin carboxyl-terminal hydrolase 1 [Mycena olivaceomarginata]|nr:peptidase C12 ubiquitin carboxyl-terminal hydrolase 1 [Mycena olivaceomarginata]